MWVASFPWLRAYEHLAPDHFEVRYSTASFASAVAL